MELIQGQNTKLQSRFFELEVVTDSLSDVNFSAILLHSGRTIPSVNEIVQFNWCNYPDIFEFESEHLLTVDLDNIDTISVDKVLLCADLCLNRDRRASQIGSLGLQLHDREKITFNLDVEQRNERSVIIGEIYRHKEAWKFRALGAGFMEGMAALLKSFDAESLYQEYLTRSKPSVETQGVHRIAENSEEKALTFSGFNRESEVILNPQDTKRFEWGSHPELNVLEICGMLSRTNVEDAYFSMTMVIHIGAIVTLRSGESVRLDHKNPNPERLDDLIWLFPEQKDGLTSHTLVITKECTEVVRHVKVFAYIEGEIPYWKKAKPRLFIKPNPDQTAEVIPDHYDMACFALTFASILPGQNGVEITGESDYLDSDKDIQH